MHTVIICPRDNLVGFVQEGDPNVVLRNTATGARQRIPLAGVLGRYPDCGVIQADSEADAAKKLVEARERTATLDFTLMLFDEDLPISLKKKAVEILPDLLAKNENRDYLLDIVLAAPLPAAADIKGALEATYDSERVLELVTLIKECASRAKLAFDAWLATRSHQLIAPEDKDRVYATLAGYGVFRRLVTEGKTQAGVDKLVAKFAVLLNNVVDTRIIRDFVNEYKRALPSRKASRREPTMVSLQATIKQIEKQFGEGSIMPLGGQSLKINGIRTGSLSLDIALGGMGVPRGRIVEVFGPESSGKTTLAHHICAEAQKKGGIAAIIDAEHGFDPSWAKNLGVKLDTLLVTQPDSGEEAMQITEMLIKSNAVDVIVINSVAALVAKGETGQSHPDLQARLMSQSMRKLMGAIVKSMTVVIFINQIRENVDVMLGSPETTPVIRALKFYSSCRIDIRRVGALMEGEEVVGQRVRCNIVKNRVAPPFRVAEFDMMHNSGISFEGDVLDLGLEYKIVSMCGAWFKFNDIYLGKGKEKARTFLFENKDVVGEIRDLIMAAVGYVETENNGAGEQVVTGVGNLGDLKVSRMHDNLPATLKCGRCGLERSELIAVASSGDKKQCWTFLAILKGSACMECLELFRSELTQRSPSSWTREIAAAIERFAPRMLR